MEENKKKAYKLLKTAKELLGAKNITALHPATMKKIIGEFDGRLADDLFSKPIWTRGVMKNLKRLGINDIKDMAYSGYGIYQVLLKNGESTMMSQKDTRNLVYEALKKRKMI